MSKLPCFLLVVVVGPKVHTPTCNMHSIVVIHVNVLLIVNEIAKKKKEKAKTLFARHV
eukprot:m.278655 g.278655  ORF g.278655 m.278655 type:complete len:58 (+) comp96741_c0_seq1:192-365(+)